MEGVTIIVVSRNLGEEVGILEEKKQVVAGRLLQIPEIIEVRGFTPIGVSQNVVRAGCGMLVRWWVRNQADYFTLEVGMLHICPEIDYILSGAVEAIFVSVEAF